MHVYSIYSSGKVDEKATQLHAIASLKVLLDATKPQDGVNGTGGTGAAGDQAQDSGRASQGTEVKSMHHYLFPRFFKSIYHHFVPFHRVNSEF